MKKYIIILLTLPFLLSSCLKDNSDVFEGLPGERMNEAMIRTNNILKDAPNGWMMNYYPGRSTEYGGFLVYMKFDGNEKITIASEVSVLTGKTTVAAAKDKDSSIYTIGQDYGLTLNLITYNNLFHIFSEPNTGIGGDKNLGMGGDAEFIVMSAEPNKVVIRGKKAKFDFVLTPLSAGKTWEQSLKEYYAVESEMDAMPSYQFELNGQVYDMSRYVETLTWRNFSIILSSSESIDAPYHYTMDGIEFRTPLVIDGVEIASMKWNGAGFVDELSGAKISKITSKNSFTVSTANVKATSVSVSVSPAIATEHYYIGAYPKADENSKSETQIINELMANIKSVSDLSKGDATKSVKVKELTEYVACAFGVYVNAKGEIAASTGLYKSDSFITLKDEPASEAYKAWLGTWTVTSTSSAVNNAPLAIDIIIAENERNSTYSITGWDISVFRNDFPVVAKLVNGKLTIDSFQTIGKTSDGNVKYVGYGFAPSNGKYYYFGGEYVGLTCTLSGDKKTGSVVGYSGNSSIGTINVQSMLQAVYDNKDELVGSYGPDAGFTKDDHQTGTLNMVKKSGVSAPALNTPFIASYPLHLSSVLSVNSL